MTYGYKTGGRKKGSLNRRTTELDRIVKKHYRSFNPIIELIQIYKDAETPLEHKIVILKEISPFLYPKRKAVAQEIEANIQAELSNVEVRFTKEQLLELLPAEKRKDYAGQDIGLLFNSVRSLLFSGCLHHFNDRTLGIIKDNRTYLEALERLKNLEREQNDYIIKKAQQDLLKKLEKGEPGDFIP